VSRIKEATDFAVRGWSPVPIPLGEKGPKIPGWGKLRLTIEELPRYFSGDCNIGIILGPPSGELVDIDLDCPEALVLADRYLPSTGAEFGRQSKPRSHRLYIAAGAVHEPFADPIDGSTLLELRAAGRDGGCHQTVFPPSVHPSGEAIRWTSEIIAPAVFDAARLRRRCAWLAIGCLVRKYLSEHASERPGPDLAALAGINSANWPGTPLRQTTRDRNRYD
jgi:Bifunctional DNA primase/polymerase, N-terminal